MFCTKCVDVFNHSLNNRHAMCKQNTSNAISFLLSIPLSYHAFVMSPECLFLCWLSGVAPLWHTVEKTDLEFISQSNILVFVQL